MNTANGTDVQYILPIYHLTCADIVVNHILKFIITHFTYKFTVNIRVPTHPGKSRNFRREFLRPGKSWKMIVVMESYGIVMEFHQQVMTFLTDG